MVDKDDLRFGDRGGGSAGPADDPILGLATLAIRVFVLIIVLYAVYQGLGIMFPFLPFA